jgi:hypothetical protein
MATTRSTPSGKTSQARSVPVIREGLTLLPCSRRSQKPRFQYLSPAAGQTQEWLEATELLSLGACLTPRCGESPSVAAESSLSQVLEPDAPARYSLSRKACEGILRRAQKRGKELPPMLREALEAQCQAA